MGVYWLAWFAASFLTFIGPEVYVLVTGRSQLTLSAYIWRMEELVPDQPIWLWPAAHFLIGGALGIVLIWLIGHFLFGIWA